MTRNARRTRLTLALIWSLAACFGRPLTIEAAGGLAAIDAFHVGRHYLASGDREAALESFNDALRLNPQFVQAYVARGKLLAEMGQHTAALADLNFALQLQPTHAEGFAYRGYALLSLDRADEALADFDFALRLDPSYARVHYLRSQTLLALGDAAGSEASRAVAMNLDPTIEAVRVASATIDPLHADSQVVHAAPTAPERTSVMPWTKYPASSPEAGGPKPVVRYEGHPTLANLQPPSVSLPRESRTPPAMPVRPRTAVSTAARPMSPQPGAAQSASRPMHPRTPPMVDQAIDFAPAPPDEPLSVEESVVVEQVVVDPVITTLPPYFVDDTPPPASAVLGGYGAEATLLSKPTPSESEQRLTAALDAAKHAAAERAASEPTPTVAATPNAEESAAVVGDEPAPPAPPAELVALPPTEMPADLASPTGSPVPVVEAPQPVAPPTLVDVAAPVLAGVPVTELDDAVRQNPGDAMLRCRRGELHLAAGFYAAATADFDEALKASPNSIDALYGRAVSNYLSGRPADAVVDYTAVIRLDDHHAAARIERGHCFAQLGRFAEAAEDRYAALALEPSLAKTGPHYDVAPPPAAAAVAEDATVAPAAAPQSYPQSAFGNLFAGSPPLRSAEQPQAADAPQAVQRAVAVDVPQPSGVVIIEDDFAAAPAAPTAAIDDASPLEAAVGDLTAELAQSPGDARLYVMRAQALLALQRLDDAADDVTAALRIDPKSKAARSLAERIENARSRAAASAAGLELR